MLTTHKLKIKPSTARKIISMARFRPVDFGDDLVDLAMEDVVTPARLEGFGGGFCASEMEAIQHIEDWSRCLVMDRGRVHSRRVSLVGPWLHDEDKIVILAYHKNFAAWREEILRHWPDAKICFFGDSRHQAACDDVDLVPTPDPSARFYVTGFSGFVHSDIAGDMDVKRVIVDDDVTNATYRWFEPLRVSLMNVPKLVMLGDILDLPSEAGATGGWASMAFQGSSASQRVDDLLVNWIWCNSREVTNFVSGGSRAKPNMKNLDRLSLLGANFSLVEATNGDRIVRFYDRNGATCSKSLAERQRELVMSSGSSIACLVDDALRGDSAAQELLRPLMSNQWAATKTRYLLGIKATMGRETATRCLFITSNQNAARFLMLNLGRDVGKWQISGPNNFSNVIATHDQVLANPACFDDFDVAFLVDAPLSADQFSDITDALSDQMPLMISVMVGTFEDHIYRVLLKDF